MKTLSLTTKQVVAAMLFASLFTACKKDVSEAVNTNQDQLNSNNASEIESVASKASNNGTTTDAIPFSATAAINDCYGENIIFSGTIENKVNTTVDENGTVHYTRHWTVKGLTGIGAETGTVFDVVGGAEMFSIKGATLNANGSLNMPASLISSDVFIHQGTVVFVSRTDGSRVVARHIIRKVPGQNTTISKWVCAGN